MAKASKAWKATTKAKFNASKLRRLTRGAPICIRRDACSPLILIKADGRITFATGRTDKDALVERFNEDEDVLLLAWAGEFRTDVFTVSRKDLNRFYDPDS